MSSEEKPVASSAQSNTSSDETAAVQEAGGAKVGKDGAESPFPDQEVNDLARQYTRQSQGAAGEGPYDDPFSAEKDGPLDPFSPKFHARKWVEAMMSLSNRTQSAVVGRRAGVSFQDLGAHGFGSSSDYQKTVGNIPRQAWDTVRGFMGNKGSRIEILSGLDGLVKSGEMLVVLGPPGSGCSTFLKTLAGETHGFVVDEAAQINYEGISAEQMHHDFRGEAIYTAEVDVHFPQLTVGDTLSFAANARAPRLTPGNVPRHVFAQTMRDVVMAIFGITHTVNTMVGNDFIRGVSGGERKRVSIAEASLSGAPLSLWDNSTRGLDSANAIEFCKTLRMNASLTACTSCVAIYQSPESAYQLFDKVLVLYEGRQIYFGPINDAKTFFVDMGFDCPARQTTPDFLTSLTSHLERKARPGFESRVPHSPDEFAKEWKKSQTYKNLKREIVVYETGHPIGGPDLDRFVASRRAQQSKQQRISSPYTLSYAQQVKLCLWRGYRRLMGNPEMTLTSLIGNSIMALIIGSVFYNLKPDTSSFFQRGALLFFSILMSAFSSMLEIHMLYAQRPIVEKHTRYALYHPSAEAFASMLVDLPYKVGNAILFTLTLYFMTNLRREPGAYFFFLLISFSLGLCMSMFFRAIAATSRTLSQALAPAAIVILALIIYTGFVIPTKEMLGWSRWINYIDPISYGFEALMVNEFTGRNFSCSAFVPSGGAYDTAAPLNRICSAVGSAAGASFVNGDDYINTSFEYYVAHKWRDFGIIIVFTIGLGCLYLAASEFISAKKSKGEVLVFQLGHKPAFLKRSKDVETSGDVPSQKPTQAEKKTGDAIIPKQTAIFQWEDVCYDVKIKTEDRRILDNVDGWVKPGTVTALMGVSGAGKTTLLDILSTRVSVGTISGRMLVDGKQRDDSFQRKTGYVQQQDLHLETSTVREALTFSALLRQPAIVPEAEKLAYVDEVIKLLEMEEYAGAVVGVPGEGLNVEQRKRLTIGVELAAKPDLLLFLDEPTSGLDSQTSWAISDLLEKLRDHGQAILCTIHQPSAMLFQRFDRLLFLAKGGKTVYFGELGDNASVLTSYFERNGSKPFHPDANPAEVMMEIIGAAPGSTSEIDWPAVWRGSKEYRNMKQHLAELESTGLAKVEQSAETNADPNQYKEFAAPLRVQFVQVFRRVAQQYWRTPSYISSKIALCVASALFIGFSFFKAKNTQQGLQDQLFGVFMLMTIFGNIVQQILPSFVIQRALYEARERPSKTYSWKVFMLSNICIELPWNTLAALLTWICWYYPIGLYANAEPTGAVHERGAVMFLMILGFFLFTSTFSHFIIAGMDSVETAANVGNLLFSLCLIFCGVLASPAALPKFWIFMYRVSPFTYIIEGMLTTAVANTNVICADYEYLQFTPPAGDTCITYMQDYINAFGGYLSDPSATTTCNFCSISETNVFLASVSNYYSHRWRDFGLLWVYIGFNIVAAMGIYWLARVPRKAAPTEKRAELAESNAKAQLEEKA